MNKESDSWFKDTRVKWNQRAKNVMQGKLITVACTLRTY